MATRKRSTKTIVPDTVYETRDSWGIEIEVHDRQDATPPVYLNWSEGDKALLLNQDRDVIELTVGQAYDLLTALSRALDIPVRI